MVVLAVHLHGDNEGDHADLPKLQLPVMVVVVGGVVVVVVVVVLMVLVVEW